MSATSYTKTAIVLHWVTVVLILCNLPLGIYVHGLDFSPTKLVLLSFHKWIGITVLLVVVVRFYWRYKHDVPPLPDAVPRWQRYAAHMMHAMLYALLVAVPMTGWLLSSAKGVPVVYFGLIPLPDLIGRNMVVADFLIEVHEFLNKMMLLLIFGHVAAAFKHHFINHDDVLQRMLPWKK